MGNKKKNKFTHSSQLHTSGVDLGGIPLRSREPQISRRNTRFAGPNPAGMRIAAGIPVFAAIWGPDFWPSIIILTNMFKQIKQIRITLMTMFKVEPSPPNELR